jgi:hypothetical protein
MKKTDQDDVVSHVSVSKASFHFKQSHTSHMNSRNSQNYINRYGLWSFYQRKSGYEVLPFFLKPVYRFKNILEWAKYFIPIKATPRIMFQSIYVPKTFIFWSNYSSYFSKISLITYFLTFSHKRWTLKIIILGIRIWLIRYKKGKQVIPVVNGLGDSTHSQFQLHKMPSNHAFRRMASPMHQDKSKLDTQSVRSTKKSVFSPQRSKTPLDSGMKKKKNFKILNMGNFGRESQEFASPRKDLMLQKPFYST